MKYYLKYHSLPREGIWEHLPSLYRKGKEAMSIAREEVSPVGSFSLGSTDFPPLNTSTAEIIEK